MEDRSSREGDSWDRRCYTGRKRTDRDVCTRERAVQHLFPLELSCDKTKQSMPAKFNVEATEFEPRPKRRAAVEAENRIAAVRIEEE